MLAECATTKHPGIKPLDPISERKWANKKKYYRYHRSNGHNTNECHTLKDDIEEIITNGTSQYVKKKEDQPKGERGG